MYESKQIGIKKLYLKKRVRFGLENSKHSGYISELTEKTVVIDAYEDLPKGSLILCEIKEDNQIIKFNAEVISVSKESIGNRINANITNQYDLIRKFYLEKLKKQSQKTKKPEKKKFQGFLRFLRKST